MNSPSSQPSGPCVVSAGTGHLVELGDHRGRILMSARNTGGAFVLFEMQADPDAHVTPHSHRHEDETYVVLEGRFALEVGGQSIEAGAGDTVFAPRDMVHQWRCVSLEGGKALVLITPGANFEAFGAAMAQQGFVPSVAMADPASAPVFMALSAQFGIEMLLPEG